MHFDNSNFACAGSCPYIERGIIMDYNVTVRMIVNGDRYTFNQFYYNVRKPEEAVKLAMESIGNVFQDFAEILEIKLKVMRPSK